MIPVKHIVNGKEVSKEEYSRQFEMQSLLYGTCVIRTSMLDDGTFIVELIDYTKVWKQVGGPEPVTTGSVGLKRMI